MKYNKFIILFIIIGLLSGCVNEPIINETIPNIEQNIEEAEIKPVSGGQLNLAIRNPNILNPLLNEDKSVDEVLKLVYDDLIGLDENLKPTPNLAESWRLDGSTITINLRTDVRWHDGNQFTAKDVAFSIDTITKSQDISPYKVCVSNILRTTIIDDYTIEILFSEAYSGAVYSLNFPIISSEYYQGEDVLNSYKNMIPLGTGAYEFESFDNMKQLSLKKNPAWFKGSPYIDKINAIVIPKKDAELHAFEQGQIDFLNTDIVDWEKYSGTKETTIHEYTTNYYEFLGFNFNNWILNNTLVRQAIAYAIPRNEIIQKIYLDHAVATDTPINPNSWLNSNKDLRYNYDISKAKELLNQAGFVDTDENGIVEKEGYEFRISLLVNEDNAQRVEVAAILQQSLKNIGIDLAIDIQNYDEYMKRLTEKNFEAVLGGWKLSTIPDLSFAFKSSQIAEGNNFISFNNPTMDSLLDQTHLSVTESSMTESYKNLGNFIIEELPYISLYFRNAAVLMDGDIKGNIDSNMSNVYLGIEKCFIYNE